MLWFFLWRSEKKERRQNFDCEICSENQWHLNRVCFHPLLGEETYPIMLPTCTTPKKTDDPVETIVDETQFLTWLEAFNEVYNPDMPSFEIVQSMVNTIQRGYGKPEICLTSFIDTDLASLVELEDACNNYHVLPYEGGLLDQPLVLLEVFNTIRETKNRYENIRNEKLLGSTNKSGSTSSKPSRKSK